MLSQSRNLLQFQATRFVRRQQFRIDPEVENQIHKRWVWECCFSCFRTPVNKGELQSRRLRPHWWQLPERFRSLAVYEVSHECPENISHFLIVRL